MIFFLFFQKKISINQMKRTLDPNYSANYESSQEFKHSRKNDNYILEDNNDSLRKRSKLLFYSGTLEEVILNIFKDTYFADIQLNPSESENILIDLLNDNYQDYLRSQNETLEISEELETFKNVAEHDVFFLNVMFYIFATIEQKISQQNSFFPTKILNEEEREIARKQFNFINNKIYPPYQLFTQRFLNKSNHEIKERHLYYVRKMNEFYDLYILELINLINWFAADPLKFVIDLTFNIWFDGHNQLYQIIPGQKELIEIIGLNVN